MAYQLIDEDLTKGCFMQAVFPVPKLPDLPQAIRLGVVILGDRMAIGRDDLQGLHEVEVSLGFVHEAGCRTPSVRTGEPRRTRATCRSSRST